MADGFELKEFRSYRSSDNSAACIVFEPGTLNLKLINDNVRRSLRIRHRGRRNRLRSYRNRIHNHRW